MDDVNNNHTMPVIHTTAHKKACKPLDSDALLQKNCKMFDIVWTLIDNENDTMKYSKPYRKITCYPLSFQLQFWIFDNFIAMINESIWQFGRQCTSKALAWKRWQLPECWRHEAECSRWLHMPWPGGGHGGVEPEGGEVTGRRGSGQARVCRWGQHWGGQERAGAVHVCWGCCLVQRGWVVLSCQRKINTVLWLRQNEDTLWQWTLPTQACVSNDFSCHVLALW